VPAIDLPGEAIAVALVINASGVFRSLENGPLSNSRNARRWVAAGAAMGLALAWLVRTDFALAWPAAVLLMLVWAAPLISLLLLRSQRLLLRMRMALNGGDVERAEGLLAGAAEAVNQSSPVDLEWNRVQLSELEGSIRMAQGRFRDAVSPLRESYLRAVELGVPCYVRESGCLLLECYRTLELWDDAGELARQLGINLDSPAMRASDIAASVPAGPADTISPRIL
jgi:hypothetical protein